MKLQSIYVLSCAALTACASTPPTPPMEIVRIHEVAGKSKGDLCRAARDWAALTFRDSKAVVEVFDPEAGSMIGKGLFTMQGPFGPMPTRFTMVVECRDARVRATYRDVIATATIGSTRHEFVPSDSALIKTRTQAEAEILGLDQSLERGLQKKAEDW